MQHADDESSHCRETPCSWQVMVRNNLWQSLACRNLSHMRRNPARLINKIPRTGQLAEVVGTLTAKYKYKNSEFRSTFNKTNNHYFGEDSSNFG